MSSGARRFFGCFVPLTLAVFGCGMIVVLVGAGRAVVQVRTVADAAMAPTLEEGWEATVFYTQSWADEPQVGAISELLSPDGRTFRRIVAGPGDTVSIDGGALIVNGRPSDPALNPQGAMEDLAPLLLAEGEYFVLSDDRSFSDSRAWGPIERNRIFGSPLFYDDGSGARGVETGIREDWEAAPTPALE